MISSYREGEKGNKWWVYTNSKFVFFMCPKNSDHIVPYQLPSVIFSDRAKIYFLVLLSSHNPKITIEKNVCMSVPPVVCASMKSFWLLDCLLLPYIAYLNDSPWVVSWDFHFVLHIPLPPPPKKKDIFLQNSMCIYWSISGCSIAF